MEETQPSQKHPGDTHENAAKEKKKRNDYQNQEQKIGAETEEHEKEEHKKQEQKREQEKKGMDDIETLTMDAKTQLELNELDAHIVLCREISDRYWQSEEYVPLRSQSKKRAEAKLEIEYKGFAANFPAKWGMILKEPLDPVALAAHHLVQRQRILEKLTLKQTRQRFEAPLLERYPLPASLSERLLQNRSSKISTTVPTLSTPK